MNQVFGDTSRNNDLLEVHVDVFFICSENSIIQCLQEFESDDRKQCVVGSLLVESTTADAWIYQLRIRN